MSNFTKKFLSSIRYYVFSFNGLALIKYSIIRKIMFSLWKHFTPEFVMTEGHKIYLDPKDSLGLSLDPNYEPQETQLLKKIIKKNSTVIDIGANIGYFTLLLAKLVGPDGKVFSFEPDPNNFSILEKNVKINGYSNVILTQKAISDKTETTKLYLCKYSNGMHRIYQSEICEGYVEIESSKLDDFFESVKFNGNIDFIKIDTEGSEVNVIRGIKNIINMNENIKILIEFEPWSIVQSGHSPKELLTEIENHGIKIFPIESTNVKYHSSQVESKKILKIISTEELSKRFNEKNLNYVNLFCSKEENLVNLE